MPIRVSFEIPPEEFSSSSALCCQFKRKAKAGELTNATAIITHLITQANKENINLHPILLDIHYALELCGTIQEANGALYEALVEVTLSLVTSNDDKLPSFDYLQVLPRIQEPFKTHVHESTLVLFDGLTSYISEGQLLKAVHAYSLLVSSGFISCDVAMDFAIKKLNSTHTECGLLVLGKLLEKNMKMLEHSSPIKRHEVLSSLNQISDEKFTKTAQFIISAFKSISEAKTTVQKEDLPSSPPTTGSLPDKTEASDCPLEGAIDTNKIPGLHWRRLFGEYASGSTMSLCCDAKGNLISGGKESLLLWDKCGKEITRYPFPLHNTHPMDADRATNHLYAAGLPKTPTASNPALVRFSVSEEYVVRVEKAVSKKDIQRVSCIKALYSGKTSTEMVVTGETHKNSDIGFVRIYNKNMDPYITYQEHQGHVSALARFPRSTELFYSSAQDTTIKLWDTRQEKSAAMVGCHEAMASCLGTHPLHENLLVSGGSDGLVYLWDVRANIRIEVKSLILQVALVPDSANHAIVSSVNPNGVSPLGLSLLDFSQGKFTTTLRRNVNSPTDDVTSTTKHATGHYLALEFSSVLPNVLYAAGMDKSCDKSVVDVYECNV